MTIVNFGCGATPGPSCLNIDGSMTVILTKLPLPANVFGSRSQFVTAAREHKIRFGTARWLRFPEASLDAFYTSHTLEHLSRKECENLLGRIRRWLKPGGVLRIVLPDLKALATAYVSGRIDAETFVINTHFTRPDYSVFGISLARKAHRWMYDCASFTALLSRLEYREIQSSKFASSRLPELANLDVAAREKGSFYVEAIR